MKAFLSYSRRDQGPALALAAELKALGVLIWVDQIDIAIGSAWDSSIETALRQSEALVILLSPNSVRSQPVLDELGYALDERKPIVPVLLEPCDKPLRIRRFQHIRFETNIGHVARLIVGALGKADGNATAARNAIPLHAIPSANVGERMTAAQPAEVTSSTGGAALTPSTLGPQAEISRSAPTPPHPKRSKRGYAKEDVTTHERKRSLGNIRRRLADARAQMRAIDVALSEVPRDMTGERLRLGLLREQFAVKCQTYEAALGSGLHTVTGAAAVSPNQYPVLRPAQISSR